MTKTIFFLLLHFSFYPVFEKTKDHQRTVIRHFCLVCNEPCCIALASHRKHSNEMGFYRKRRRDLDVLYWTADIPDRKPVLSIKREKVK